MNKTAMLSLVLCAAIVTGCSGMGQREQRVVSGTAIGGALGAGVGAVTPGLGVGTGAAIGAAGGAATGLIIDETDD